MKKTINHLMSTRVVIALLIPTLSLIYSCIDDKIINIGIGTGSSTEQLVTYLETHGDYINSYLFPSLVSVNTVQANLGKYHVIDIRPDYEFEAGHIPGAINVKSEALLDYAEMNSIEKNYQVVVIVSSTGEHSGYCTLLLRVAGYNNVFSLNFGMSYWHTDFADAWMNGLDTLAISLEDGFFDNIDYPMPPLGPLPDIEVPENNESLDELLKHRIKMLLAKEFVEGGDIGSDVSECSISAEIFLSSYILKDDVFMICYSDRYLYNAGEFIPGEYRFHPVNCVLYFPPMPASREDYTKVTSTFRSSQDLQTLPADKEIIIYSYSGQRSAFLVAYLQLIGYNARSIRFGASKLISTHMKSHPNIIPFVFNPFRIMNYDYESGG
ncbi:MAG: rhodanese-like domain-containing protein [Melioribacteraceae bacterium]|nr:rhodanese-like domain-containing protein [Melioribacteraceae bacterium]